MKKIVFSISTLVIIITTCLLFVCSPAANAKKLRSFVYDKGQNKETVFLYDSTTCMLTPHLKYEFTTSENGQSKTKKAYRWNADDKMWIPSYIFIVTNVGDSQIQEFARWSAEKNEFCLNRQKAIFDRVDGSNISNYISFKWNDRSKKWEIIDGEQFEKNIALLVNHSKNIK